MVGKGVSWQKQKQIKLFTFYFKLNTDGSVQGNPRKVSAGVEEVIFVKRWQTDTA